MRAGGMVASGAPRERARTALARARFLLGSNSESGFARANGMKGSYRPIWDLEQAATATRNRPLYGLSAVVEFRRYRDRSAKKKSTTVLLVSS